MGNLVYDKCSWICISLIVLGYHKGFSSFCVKDMGHPMCVKSHTGLIGSMVLRQCKMSLLDPVSAQPSRKLIMVQHKDTIPEVSSPDLVGGYG